MSFVFLAGTSTTLGQQSAVAVDRQVKNRVNKLGAGAKVTVYMKDGTKIRGSISQILDDSFDVTLKEETQSRVISYRDVEKIKERGWSSSAKIGAGVAIGAGAIIGVILVVAASVGGGSSSSPLGP